jgi:predicted alpha-1,6-mannanase (GH76 family)
MERAKMHADKLLTMQKHSTHLWKRAGWWNSANIFEALLDYHRLSGTDFSAEIRTIYRRNLHGIYPHFNTRFAFDDNEWWALAWLKAYEMTGERKYLKVSEDIFQDMVHRSWDTICGGGVEWQNMHHYKNSITNELFITLAARLALTATDSTDKQYYLAWALKDWQWFRHSRMFTDSLWVSDGLNKDCSCVLSAGLDLTYTNGVILGGMKYLYDLTGDRSYLDLAQRMAHFSMKKYSNNLGVLTEYGDPHGGNKDILQFKGIYIRNLALLNTDLHDDSIRSFILYNADHGWQHCRSSDGYCDYNWNGPFYEWTGSAQGSFMDLMNAAIMQQ